ncbi:MAG: hypothetical protein LC745_00880 [Planctomycetia bacterium]|nr:hypothetical protein [Planctomycetia bacterium]
MARTLLDFGPLLAMTAALSVVQAAYFGAEVTPPPSIAPLSSVGYELALIVWVMADARRRRCVPCFEFGFLVAVFYPASMFWYVFWTRGWRGLALLAAVFGLLTVPAVVSVLVRVLVSATA